MSCKGILIDLLVTGTDTDTQVISGGARIDRDSPSKNPKRRRSSSRFLHRHRPAQLGLEFLLRLIALFWLQVSLVRRGRWGRHC